MNESYNQGVSSFTPDLMFQNLTDNYANAEKIYGKKLIRLLAGYDPSYIKKNVRIPEFCKELKLAIESNIKNLKKEDLLDNDGAITSKGIYLASLVLYTEELDHLVPKGYLGKKEHKRKTQYGDKEDIRSYHNHDRFRDIDMKKSIKKSIRRNHKSIIKDDLTVSQRKSKGNRNRPSGPESVQRFRNQNRCSEMKWRRLREFYDETKGPAKNAREKNRQGLK